MPHDLTAQDVKRIREKYGLTQQGFARLLGLGEASVVRYENGQKPSKANANLIRAANDPAFMRGCLERDGELLSIGQREKTEKIVYALISFDEDGGIMDINEMYMLTLEQEILNEKAAEILAEVSRLYLEAESKGDKEGMLVYDDVMSLIAERKRQIIYKENDSFTKLAEIRGSIEGLERLAKRVHRRAA